MRLYSLVKEINNTSEYLNQVVTEVEVNPYEMTKPELFSNLDLALEKVEQLVSIINSSENASTNATDASFRGATKGLLWNVNDLKNAFVTLSES